MDISSVEIQSSHYQSHLDEAVSTNLTPEEVRTQKQIELDCRRTFGPSRITHFLAPIEQKQNVLYNVLSVYARVCPEVGYC